jgi:dihydroorotate dehydrogenase (NAD+) catalytic subunit
MVDLQQKLKAPVAIGGVEFPNPIWLASGTAGYGEELAEMMDISKLGAIVLKGTTLIPKEGNPTPRLVESGGSLINSIGLQNPGIEKVLTDKLFFLKEKGARSIINIAGQSEEDYEKLARRIAQAEGLDGIEVNLSCPNVERLMDNGTSPDWVEKIVRIVKEHSNIPVIAKLTPNITDITTIAAAAEQGGADAVSLINTFKGMAFNLQTQQPILANKFGGVSGPGLKSIALRMVYEVKQKVRIPIVGMGGIMCAEDVMEFFCAGASAVQIGTLNFIDINKIIGLVS